ncbi:hypothetical protein [Streptomyces wuyuanensis]|uniref:hypothetical protein n=1 Tax=Streptomyces wuyuanensis TaxID=1196353 RepID=UPI0037129303
MNTAKRKEADGTEPLTVEAGADETEAFTERDRGDVIMRVGAVVVHLNSDDDKTTAALEQFSVLQVERIEKAAAGQEPEA